MRRQLADYLYREMAVNEDIFFITADLGYRLWDQIRDTYSNRFLNCGASEMAGMGIAVGLALEGKISIFYSISTFAIYRPFETIKTYLHHEQIPVKIIGGGRDRDYHIDGYSHDASEIKDFMNPMNIEQYYPEGENLKGVFEESLEAVFKDFLYNKKPSYLNLRK